VRQRRPDQALQFRDDLVHAFRREVEREDFDRDEPIAFRIERTKNSAKRSCTNLMKNPKRTEGVRR
jgi:hypothetical protein